MTPNSIEILLHCYVSPSPHPRENASEVSVAFSQLEAEGLITFDDGGGYWKTTQRGAAHVQQLCALPFPEMAWVNSCGEVIKDGRNQ